MLLTLEAVGAKADTLAERRKTFSETGGTIGRAPKAARTHWLLPDQQVSQNHAAITFTNGQFYIEDSGSTNGIVVDSVDGGVQRLPPRRPRPLNSGDTIVIEPYRIQVTLEAAISSEASDEFDVSKLFPRSGDTPRSSARPNPGLHGGSPLDQHFIPPSPAPAAHPKPGAQIPENWIDSSISIGPALGEAESSKTPPRGRPPVDETPARPEPREPPLAPRTGAKNPAVAPGPPQVTLADVLASAGLDDVTVTRELAETFGQILRVVVTGVWDVLKARQEAKSELGVDMTMIRPADNNPLKFSANVDDALHNLFVKRSGAYLGPVEAFEDAFGDLRYHQLAMWAALQAAFDNMLAEFAPDHLQKEFDDQLKKGALISKPASWRYWELYRAKFHDMVRDAEKCYSELFGDEFARAYEEQLKRLKSQGRAPKR
jgi:type VI secretion system protein ImpI